MLVLAEEDMTIATIDTLATGLNDDSDVMLELLDRYP
jgi:hypothetical protein